MSDNGIYFYLLTADVTRSFVVCLWHVVAYNE